MHPGVTKYRRPDWERQAGLSGTATEGFFLLPAHRLNGPPLRVIATNGGGWDHVSVSTERRCPTWEEMEWVKRLFFDEDETAMQLHVPPADHVNCHPHCLHLWRPHAGEIPRPPNSYVGGL